MNDKDIADDMVCEALHQVLSMPERWAPRSGVRAHLLKWVWLEHGRRRSNGGHNNGGFNGSFAGERKTEASANGSSENHHAVSSEVESCFQRLEEHERHVLLLAVIRGLSCEETAFVLDISSDEVGKRLGSARNHLGALLMNEADRSHAAIATGT